MIVALLLIGFSIVAYLLLHGQFETFVTKLNQQLSGETNEANEGTGDDNADVTGEDAEDFEDDEDDEDDEEVEVIDDYLDDDAPIEVMDDSLNDENLITTLSKEEREEDEKYGEEYGVELTKLGLRPDIEAEYMSHHTGKLISELKEDADQKNVQMVLFNQSYQLRFV